jgi:competence protein ComGF
MFRPKMATFRILKSNFCKGNAVFTILLLIIIIIIIDINLLIVPCATYMLKTNTRDEKQIDINNFSLNSLLFMCRVNSYKANYRHSTVQIYITT